MSLDDSTLRTLDQATGDYLTYTGTGDPGEQRRADVQLDRLTHWLLQHCDSPVIVRAGLANIITTARETGVQEGS